ncbi:MAG: phosphotransferase [Bergeyella sp.]
MELKAVISAFIGEQNYSVSAIDNGLINHTYLIETENKKYILQKINTDIFKNPQSIISNHLAVNSVLKNSDYSRKIVDLIPARNGTFLVNQKWRMLEFIENSVTHLKVPNPETAFESAKCFSEFYSVLNSESIHLEETLTGFIDFEKRISDYQTALKNASEELKTNAEKEIDFINSHLDLPEKWIELQRKNALPKRVIHADPKISNILFDKNENAVAVIDLDTVMTSTLLYDFGDMIRSYCNLTDEDDANLEKNFSPEIYDSVKKGFLFHLENLLSETEKQLLEYAPKVVIYIQAVRFLTDYLNGNLYYSVKYENHNIDRTRNQINLLGNILRK